VHSKYKIGDKTYFRKFCQSTQITTSTDPEDICDAGGLYVWPIYNEFNVQLDRTLSFEDLKSVPSSKFNVNNTLVDAVKSSSAHDAVGGTGAQIVRIEGLGVDYRVLYEDINMDGTSEVTLKNKYLRVNEFYVIETGYTVNDKKYLSNTGDIKAYNSTAGDSVLYAQITNTNNYSRSSIYTTDEDLYITNISVHHDTEGVASNIILFAGQRNMLTPLWNILTEKPAGASHDIRSHSFNSHIFIPRGSDMKLNVLQVDGTIKTLSVTLEGYFLS
tara:strand:+ start:2633 stop:3451 length:819 start_codon:yes stop_codon:yes gene_type:complete